MFFFKSTLSPPHPLHSHSSLLHPYLIRRDVNIVKFRRCIIPLNKLNLDLCLSTYRQSQNSEVSKIKNEQLVKEFSAEKKNKKQLEMCQYDTDASAQVFSHTNRHFEKNKVEKSAVTLITRAPEAGHYTPTASYKM